MDPEVFVTGGRGVVGRAIVAGLRSEGRRLRVPSHAECDVLDLDGLCRAMDGCEVAYHVAGVNRFCARGYEADAAGQRRRIGQRGRGRRKDWRATARLHIVGGDARGGARHRWSGGLAASGQISVRLRSKYDAERAVLQAAADRDVNVVCVNPSSVQGPGRASGTGRVLVDYLRGELRFWVDTTVSFVDIDDCARGHLLAEARGEPGARYVLNAVSLDTEELLALMARVAPGVRPPRVVPTAFVRGAVAATAALARVRGKTPVVCSEALRTLLYGHRYDGRRATRELGLVYRPAEETVRRTAEWLVAEGLAPPSAFG